MHRAWCTQDDERTEEIADDGEEITGARTSNKPGVDVAWAVEGQAALYLRVGEAF